MMIKNPERFVRFCVLALAAILAAPWGVQQIN
jgi:hypothetical protein